MTRQRRAGKGLLRAGAREGRAAADRERRRGPDHRDTERARHPPLSARRCKGRRVAEQCDSDGEASHCQEWYDVAHPGVPAATVSKLNSLDTNEVSVLLSRSR